MLEYNSIAPRFCNDLVSGVTVPSRAKSSGVSHLDHCIDFDSRLTSGPFWRDETIANFLQALVEDKTSASFLKTCSWGTEPSLFFVYAFLLNDVSARFFQMFGKRRENSILKHFWSQGGTPRHPESAQGTPESTAWIFH